MSNPIEPQLFTEASIRADRLTPETVGRKVLITTTEGATLMGELDGYVISAVRDPFAPTYTVARPPVSTYIKCRFLGIDNEVEVRGNSEVKVLA